MLTAFRTAEPKYLVEALDKALSRLKERAESLPESDNMKIRIELLITDLESVKDSIDKSSKTGKISGAACFNLWCLSAVSVNLIASHLDNRGR
jgi:hypothetical protein